MTMPVARTEQPPSEALAESLEGRSVAELLASEPMTAAEAVRVIVAAAKIVAVAHEHGKVHGDLKASNVFVTGAGDVRVLGLEGTTAQSRGGRPTARAQSARYRVAGIGFCDVHEPWQKVSFFPGRPSPHDDVCALSSLLLQLLARRARTESPFTQSDPTTKLLVEPGLEPLVELLLRCSSPEPEKLHTALEFASDLEQAASALRAEAQPSEPPPATPTRFAILGLIGKIFAGRYLIEDVIGQGSTSIVCRARHLDRATDIALKVLSPASPHIVDEAHDRFEFEAQILAGLQHPNVITVFEVGSTDDGFRYIAMELLKGETLADQLLREERLSPKAAVLIACQAAEALAALHERGLLHRDVKPANLFVTRDASEQKVIKLMDFGLARVLSEASANDGPPQVGPRRRLNTRDGLILGTVPYMSPELIQGLPLDQRSDVYALGVVTYRMLTGSLPFIDDDMPRVLARHMCEPVEPPSERAPDAGISRALESAVLRALAKGPDERPADARAFAEELRAALQVDAEPAPDSEGRLASRRRHVARWVTGGVVLGGSLLALPGIVTPRTSAERAEVSGNVANVRMSPVSSSTVSPVSNGRASVSEARPAATERERVVRRPPRPRTHAEISRTAPPPLSARIQQSMEDDLKTPDWASRPVWAHRNSERGRLPPSK